MELICGLTGLSVEEIKVIRRKSKEEGFQCQVKGGHLVFKGSEEKKDWVELLNRLEREKNIIPLYVKIVGKEEERDISLDYIKNCLKINANNYILQNIGNGLKGILRNIIYLRGGVYINIKKIQENGKTKSNNKEI